ncbi:FAD/FMN-containing dehydrogenase [Lutimaribacter pacificus]|uniref:FAD/FMN-containing dehydrogenase n=1 Tax=Lutimaribacter pacificus TaxID=391948 RepID=A0A1H0BQ17_9RHOB|nr:FAD-binding oxidoreductase [Lutimaribacter pacificus]SDN47613.1 FAD/FMN-containing dehydrogenase [Lutimaribacter pacificus]SHJ53671.1 FAD/FMN-containing dehydrogenase [Lutimaribacter pacificus]
MLRDADQGFVDHLRGLLSEPALRAPEPRYLEEPRGRWAGRAAAVAVPGSVEEVATVLRACNAARVGVVPYGGGTGLVGGQVAGVGPVPVLLSLERMRAIRAVHAEENVMEAEAGAILQDIHAAAEAADRLYPLSIASKGSARIGGLLGTNAGGVNVLRYGNARDLCLGLEVVLADGRIWNGLSRLRKDNTGYDLRNLMIGSEGTLGVITAASLKLAPRPAGEGTALMVVESPAAALSLLSLARDRMGEGISAFEMMHRTGLDFLAEALPDIRQPFDTPSDWFVLIDVGLAAGLDPAAALEALFADAFDKGLVSDGVIAQSGAQRRGIWEVREQIPEANRRIGSISSHDISLPMGEVAAFIERGGAALARLGDFRINCFGHLGDGNLHYNVFPPKGRDRSEFRHLGDGIKTCVHDLVDAMGGSVSAEHGIGRLKVGDLERYGDPVKLELMRGIKDMLDPNGILNPGAVLRARG